MIRAYLSAGLKLCAIKPNSKQPHGKAWEQAPLTEPPPNGYGIGLIHALNGTCSLDIDDIEAARLALASIDVDLDALLAAPDAVQINSRPGRGKLMYRFPSGIEPRRHNLNWPSQADAAKRFCVIEFRAGAVQDVLPPSIHPDTGMPYEWGGAGDWRNLPMLPDQLAKAWAEWDLAKAAMMDACPWRAASVPREVSAAPLASRPARGAGVIGAFNDAHEPGSILEQHGYRPAGNRWLSPHSETRIPGVILLPDSDPPCVFVHHASDPLSDGHRHDAFSLFCHLDHDGDVIAAIRAAADLLGIVREEDKEGAALAERLLASRKSNVVPIPPPKRQKSVGINPPNPGPIPCPQLREIQQMVQSGARAYKHDAVIQATLSLACSITARRYQTNDMQPTTAFFGITDTSIAGLRPLNSVLYGISSCLGERAAMRGTRIPSSGVFYAAMLAHPRLYWVTDEYGHLVRMSGRQQSGALESAISVLHKAYEGKTLYLDRDTATTGRERDIKDADIHNATVTLLALMCQDDLATIGSRQEYGRGTLQQMLICHAGDDTIKSSGIMDKPSKSLIEWVKRLQSIPGIAGAEQISNIEPMMTTVEMSDEAQHELDESASRMRAFMALDDSRTEYKGMVIGYQQSAFRVACSLAAWNDPENPTLTGQVARWAALWCERCLMQTVPRVVVTASDTDEPDVMQRVMQVLLDTDKALTTREIAIKCRAFRRLGTEERDKLMIKMADDGYCIPQKSEQTTRYISSLTASSAGGKK